VLLPAIYNQLYKFWEKVDLVPVGDFAEKASRAMAMVSTSIEALNAVAGYEPDEKFRAKANDFSLDLLDLLDLLQAMAHTFVVPSAIPDAEQIATRFAPLVAFSEAVERGLSFLTPSLSAIYDLAQYVRAVNLGQTIKAFGADLLTAITGFGDLSRNPRLAPDILAALGEFAASLAEVVVQMASVFVGLNEIAGYQGNMAVVAFQTMESSLLQVFAILGRMASELEGALGMGAALRFNTAAQGIGELMGNGFSAIGVAGNGGNVAPYSLPSTVAAQQAAAIFNNSNSVNVNMGGVAIHNGMDEALFAAKVRRWVKEALA
jgi:hypothetical protein